MIKEIKSIPLAAFLSQLGHEPAARKGTRLWYRSPLRQEQTPSFKVETTLNCWYDFGIGKGGNIIDLATELYQSTDLRYLMRCIANSYPVPSVQTVATSFAPRHSAPSVERFEVVPLEHRALVAYLQERGIPAHIVKANCKEAHYSFNGKSYFAVVFENVNNGWELRNKYFKGCRGRKDISYLPWSRDGPSTECVVFEGFIDYLSALTLGIISEADAIILNSVANVNKAVPYLKDYTTINCYLDNDNAGQTALAELKAIYGSIVIDRSTLYSEFNDLNDFLVNRSQTQFPMKTNKYTATKSTELTDAAKSKVSTSNPEVNMKSDDTTNTNPAVNRNNAVNSTTPSNPDNLFGNDQIPVALTTASATTEPPKQQRIGKQQRKSDFAEFKATFLAPAKLVNRHALNIEGDLWDQLERVSRILGDRGTTVSSYANAILAEHLKQYADDIEIWRKL